MSDLGLTAYELDQLSRYNSERHRGLMHTEAWQQQMAVLQDQFDRATTHGWCDSHHQPLTLCTAGPVRGCCIVGLSAS